MKFLDVEKIFTVNQIKSYINIKTWINYDEVQQSNNELQKNQGEYGSIVGGV